MNEENETTVDRKLYEIFEEAFELYYSFESSNDATNSPEFQANIKRCTKLFEDCTRLVSICGLFSSNESYTEISSSNLKYLLLPFFLGKLTQKICGGSRSDIIHIAEVYFKDFLSRSAEYELHEEPSVSSVPSASSSNASNDPMSSLTQQVLQRNQKLEKYRQQKELQDQINVLKNVMKLEHFDEETKRDFYVKLLKLSVIDAQEEISSIDQEKPILEFQKSRQEMMPQERAKPAARSGPPLKPIIITKDLAQKAIFGLGYPSLPTMTVAEFYDERVRQGIFPDPQTSNRTSSSQQRDVNESEQEEKLDQEREEKLDQDDEYELARLRAKDEYKDDHRRGCGNRFNRS